MKIKKKGALLRMNHENARFYALTRYAGEIIVRVRITNNAKNSVFLYEVTKKKKNNNSDHNQQ